MSDQDADTIVILSSELIAEVIEQYFNKSMFRKKVKVVDLKPTETGYAFSVAFVVDVAKPIEYFNGRTTHTNSTPTTMYTDERDNRGRFTKRGVVQ